MEWIVERALRLFNSGWESGQKWRRNEFLIALITAHWTRLGSCCSANVWANGKTSSVLGQHGISVAEWEIFRLCSWNSDSRHARWKAAKTMPRKPVNATQGYM